MDTDESTLRAILGPISFEAGSKKNTINGLEQSQNAELILKPNTNKANLINASILAKQSFKSQTASSRYRTHCTAKSFDNNGQKPFSFQSALMPELIVKNKAAARNSTGGGVVREEEPVDLSLAQIV